MYCNNCGNKHDGTERFCAECGTPVAGVPVEDVYQDEQPAEQQPVYQAEPPAAQPAEYLPAEQPVVYRPEPPAEQPVVYQPEQLPGHQPAQQVHHHHHHQPTPAYPPQPAYSSQPPYPQAYPPGYRPQTDHQGRVVDPVACASFAKRVNRYGGGVLLLIGCILFTLANITEIVAFFSGIHGMAAMLWSLFNLIMTLLLVVGLWVFFGSNAAKSPGGGIPGLTMIKVWTIIQLVLFCILMGIIIIAMVVALVGGGAFIGIVGGGGEEVIIIGIILLLLVIAFFVLGIRLYYVALLDALKGIREGVKYGDVRVIRGAMLFSVINFIGIFFSLIFDGIGLAASQVIREMRWEILSEIPSDFRGIVGDILPNMNPLPIIASIAGSVGLLLILIALLQLSSSIKNEPLEVQ